MRAVFAGLTARLPSVRRGVRSLARSGWLITATIAFVFASTASGVAWEGGDAVRASDFAAHAVGLETVSSGVPRSVSQQDAVVVRDDRIGGVYALRGTLLYARFDARGEIGSPEFAPAADRPWMRVIAGRVLDVDGIPRGSVPLSMGLDSARRVVAVLGRFKPDSSRVKRWWLYDVARDAARPLRVRARPQCSIGSVAVWVDRRAYEESCGNRAASVVLRARGRDRRVLRSSSRLWGPLTLILRSRSLAVVGSTRLGFSQFDGGNVWRVLDRRRRCPALVGGVEEERAVWAGIGAGTLTWVTAGYQFTYPSYSLDGIWDVDLSGRCQASPVVRQTEASLIPKVTVNSTGGSGVAVDGRTVYYATDEGIHRLLLPAHGSAPPLG